jgi:hypothetical protein
MEHEWHTYWQNPGDSGLPTKITWKLPEGITAGPIQWPAPLALAAGPLINYGYDGEVLLLTDLASAPSLKSGAPLILGARADWLVCKDVCIPDGADLTLALPVAATANPDPQWGAPIDAARAALPRPLQGWQVSATGKGKEIELKLSGGQGTGDGSGNVRELRFFPYAEGQIEPSAPQPRHRRERPWQRARGDHRRAPGRLHYGRQPPGERDGAFPRDRAVPVRQTPDDARRSADADRRRAVRLSGRRGAEPHALRVPGAFHQGARVRHQSRQQGDDAP